MFNSHVLMIICICHFLISKVAQGRDTISPLNVNVTTDDIPVVGQTAVTLATCRVSSLQSPAKVAWELGILFKSVKKMINTVNDLEGLYTVTSSLIGAPTVLMNQQNIQCVVRHPSLKEELAIDHKIVVHYPPQLVFVTPIKDLNGFQCEADANPVATRFSWKRMNQTMPGDAIKIEGNKLYFLKVRHDLNGVYICEASNEYGTGFGSLYWQKGGFHSEL